MERSAEARDELTGAPLLRLPRFDDITVHSYYSKCCFSAAAELIAVASCSATAAGTVDRGEAVPGVLHLLSFPRGETLLSIPDVPVARHAGNQHEFVPAANALAVHLPRDRLGILDLGSRRLTEVSLRGAWRSIGLRDRSLVVASSAPEGMWLAEIDDDARLLDERPLVTEDELAAASRSVLEERDRLQSSYGNVKLSPDGRYCMFVRRLRDSDGRIRCKELFVCDTRLRTLRRLAGGDDAQYDNPLQSFHHAAWQLGANRILYHAPSEAHLHMTFRVYDTVGGRDDVLFPAFGARGHHSLLGADGSLVVTDCYEGDLAGMVCALDIRSTLVRPLGAWLLHEHLVDGHAALSPGEEWTLYSCNLEGGSEVRAIRLPPRSSWCTAGPCR